MPNLLDIVHRVNHPRPWAEGEKIPWNDPAFSQRMLAEHLSQAHDHASRRSVRIDQQVAWIHRQVLGERPARVLDLGCGPGLYAQRLARLGHTLTGIDFSPASIAYAREKAQSEDLNITYLEGDIRAVEYGPGYDLVMLIFGEFNTFKPADADVLLDKSRQALAPGGRLLLEPHTFDAIRRTGEAPPYWYSSPGGLFSDRPHLLLGENDWDAAILAATERYYLIDAATGQVTRHASSMQAYDQDAYRRLLENRGFSAVTFYPSLTGQVDETSADLIAIVAQR